MTGYQLKSVKARIGLSKRTFVWGLAIAFRVTVVSIFALGCLYLFGFDEKLNATLKAFALAFFYSDFFLARGSYGRLRFYGLCKLSRG